MDKRGPADGTGSTDDRGDPVLQLRIGGNRLDDVGRALRIADEDDPLAATAIRQRHDGVPDQPGVLAGAREGVDTHEA